MSQSQINKRLCGFIKLIVEASGGWLTLMSGPLSVLFAFWSVVSPAGHSQRYFLALLAYCALWILVIRQIESYECRAAVWLYSQSG